MLNNAKKSQKMQNQTTKKEHANTDETKFHDTINISNKSKMKLPKL